MKRGVQHVTEFQLKNYLKFMFKNIKDSTFKMVCTGAELSYEFEVTSDAISIKSSNMLLVVCDIDTIVFDESLFTIDLIEIHRVAEGEVVEVQSLPKPELTRVYYMLMSVMSKRAGLVLADKQGNYYKGCYVAGKVLYLDEDADTVYFYITDFSNLHLDVVCVTEVPGYLNFKSYIAEAEKYAKCTNRAFRKFGKKEQNYA